MLLSKNSLTILHAFLGKTYPQFHGACLFPFTYLMIDRLMYVLNHGISLLLPFRWSQSLWYIINIFTNIAATLMPILVAPPNLDLNGINLDLNLELHQP